MGFLLCRHKERMSSYDDPYLNEMAKKSGVKGVAYWSGYSESLCRYVVWLGFNDGEKILLADLNGWIVTPPTDPAQLTAFANVCQSHGLMQRNDKWILPVPQTPDGLCDTADRISSGANLLVDLCPLYP